MIWRIPIVTIHFFGQWSQLQSTQLHGLSKSTTFHQFPSLQIIHQMEIAIETQTLGKTLHKSNRGGQSLVGKDAFIEWHVVWCDFEKTCVWKRLTACSKHVTTILGLIVNIIMIWRHTWPFDKNKTLTLIMNKTFVRAPNITREVATASIWICKPSGTNRVFHVLGEVAH